MTIELDTRAIELSRLGLDTAVDCTEGPQSIEKDHRVYKI